jgi:hypothetical protein
MYTIVWSVKSAPVCFFAGMFCATPFTVKRKFKPVWPRYARLPIGS